MSKVVKKHVKVENPNKMWSEVQGNVVKFQSRKQTSKSIKARSPTQSLIFEVS
jgi:hypothetical protein